MIRAFLLISFLVSVGALPAHGGPGAISFQARVDATQAVERARYKFVINATEPFDKVYPRSVFEKKVRYQLDQEGVLKARYGVEITPDLLHDEFHRIEVMTRDDKQWRTIKNVLGDQQSLIEEVFCRPLVVDRMLRHRFGFDPELHARSHNKARVVRRRFLANKRVPEAVTLTLPRTASAQSSEEMLEQAQRPLTPQQPETPGTLPPIDPEVARVLEKELRKPGDVSTILEHRDRFVVYRLKSLSADRRVVDAVSFAKRDFDSWFASVSGER